MKKLRRAAPRGKRPDLGRPCGAAVVFWDKHGPPGDRKLLKALKDQGFAVIMKGLPKGVLSNRHRLLERLIDFSGGFLVDLPHFEGGHLVAGEESVTAALRIRSAFSLAGQDFYYVPCQPGNYDAASCVGRHLYTRAALLLAASIAKGKRPDVYRRLRDQCYIWLNKIESAERGTQHKFTASRGVIKDALEELAKALGLGPQQPPGENYAGDERDGVVGERWAFH